MGWLMTSDEGAFFAKVRERLGRFGWTSVYVPADRDVPAYSYTLGFSDEIGCEFILVGYSWCIAELLFQRLWEIVLSGREISVGRFNRVVQTMHIDIVEVAPSSAESLLWMKREIGAPLDSFLFQLILPDELGLLPGDIAIDEDFVVSSKLHGGA